MSGSLPQWSSASPSPPQPDDAPRTAAEPQEICHDVDAVTIHDDAGNDLILTAGGDCETIGFGYPDNCLRIVQDVWTFAQG